MLNGIHGHQDIERVVYGKPAGAAQRRDGIPVWGLAAAVAEPDGSFTVLY